MAGSPSPDVVRQPGAGWYADPAGDTGKRWWDGQRWTERVRAPSAGRSGRAARGAACGLWVLGALNLLVVFAMLAIDDATFLEFTPLASAIAVLGGPTLLVLGVGVWGGSRAATVGALVLLSALMLWQLSLLIAAPDAAAVVRMALTGGLLGLLVRAQRSRPDDRRTRDLT